MNILPYRDLIDVPWKNGGGVTRNIATGEIGTDIAWRLSRADVDTDGPFSNFAGLTRILTIISQNAMDLEHVDGVLHARPWKPLWFDGGLSITSHLKDGPLTDLNLMFDPKLCTANAQVMQGWNSIGVPASNDLTALHILAGHPKCGKLTFGVGDTIFLDASSRDSVELDLEDAALVLALQALNQSEDIKLCIAKR